MTMNMNNIGSGVGGVGNSGGYFINGDILLEFEQSETLDATLSHSSTIENRMFKCSFNSPWPYFVIYTLSSLHANKRYKQSILLNT